MAILTSKQMPTHVCAYTTRKEYARFYTQVYARVDMHVRTEVYTHVYTHVYPHVNCTCLYT